MRYFVYIHEKKLQMVVTDEDGKHLTDMLALKDSTSIRQTGVAKLREVGYIPISKWSMFADFQFAEVKNVDR